jgi:N-acetylglucosaminyl-diphospho-decaprenol L-rhamnosyltransferase
MTVAPELAVVVVNWNSGAYLARMLESLERHPPSVPAEVVVVDNASSDGSADPAASRSSSAGSPVRLIRNPGNRGLAAANNQGLAATSAGRVLIANPDVELTGGAVDALMAVMARRARAAFVVPRLENPDGSPQPSAGDLPRPAEALLGRRLSRHLNRGPGPHPGPAGFWWDGWDHAEEREIGRGAEACYLVRRAAVQEVGPQDERFRLDWEGIEWTARMRGGGWQVWLAPDAVVRHAGGASISQAGLRWVVESHRGMYRYFASGMPAAARPPLALAIGARAVAKAAGAAAGLPLYRWAQHRPRPAASVDAGSPSTVDRSSCG